MCGVTIGRYAFIGAGAVVREDVPDYALILGVPGKHHGWMSRHGHRLDFGETDLAVCPESKLTYSLKDGQLRCVELPEDKVLPSELAQGTAPYKKFK